MPCQEELSLEAIDPLKADHFTSRREVGIYNVGEGEAIVNVGEECFELGYKEALYIGAGEREVTFQSKETERPAKLYFNSTTAHKAYPCRKVTKADAVSVHMGSLEMSNERTINKMLVNQVLPTCQLQMGMTELCPGSVWNTMPAHVHSRRMEAYFYFEVPRGQPGLSSRASKGRPFATSWANLKRLATSGREENRPCYRPNGASIPPPPPTTTRSFGAWEEKTWTMATKTSLASLT